MQREILLDKDIKSIAADQFAGMTDLQRVTVLNPRLMLPADAFRDCPHVVIRAHSGSFAEFYAQKHGISFEKL